MVDPRIKAKPNAVRVVLADRNPIVLSGLERIFDDSDLFRVVAVAADGERFLEAVDRLTFQVGVIGWNMPYLDGRGVLHALRDRKNAPRIVIFDDNASADLARQAMAQGAAGYCPNGAPPEVLLETVAAVADGRMVFPFIDVRTLDVDPFASLTRRERELLALLRSGRAAAVIAADLGVTVNTVKFHLKNLYGKLGVHNRTQAVSAYFSAQVERGEILPPSRPGGERPRRVG